ncbi:hypothetical protein A2757_02245 [Candidatus Giovannonibacteria bacterium RIFCSPHIGHO2_01_FULL_48_47]|nr:MAG: hypothetical protein A2757_02245 [Candidatus Giovannonibacteria bacterium RIFCSPHIGHO2_01_FULL_48_47]OGF68506.1 MAG: hypothetical protein A3D61_02675 [Candidatus Giovannonibacteria bacterium RIFCSPHIGHO2_02_FULL_48_15]OGF88468.1 MAG: hypothetical protein A3B26_01950 [Candidatus Giovannonibacteria bacterium RIFCSPLOWO2_01_FULL_48_47]OGF96502.1 MAG: hypothetical protein A2613_03030 [Candidatus Giovannonibacteria bacterium RIFOXYD1_FULL_48_21]HBT81174.1 hypothetical protein [Candidatus Gio
MKNLKLEELIPLDLRKHQTVGEIVVEGMRFCSFGARMLGEVAHTLTGECRKSLKPFLIYDGKPESPLGRLLQEMVDKKWFCDLITPERYAVAPYQGGTAVVVGYFSERYEDAIFKKPDRAIFINQFEKAKPKQTQTGYYPDVIFADPYLVIPILYLTLKEYLDGETSGVASLIKFLGSFGEIGASMKEGARLAGIMFRDPEYKTILTLSGAMTPAKMGLVICDMIDFGMVDFISSTGAIQAHGLVEGMGLKHFKHDPKMSDKLLAALKLNRITDLIEPETNLDHVEKIFREVIINLDGLKHIGWIELNRMIGEYLTEHFKEQRAILKSAYEKGIPVDIPDMTNSEMFNDFFVHNQNREEKGLERLIMNAEHSTLFLRNFVLEAKRNGKKLAIFTIGGGGPRNNVQNIAPLIEIEKIHTGRSLPEVMYSMGVRICPDPEHIGSLGGCKYSENISWRKFEPDAKTAEIKADATIAWPFLVKYVMETI